MDKRWQDVLVMLLVPAIIIAVVFLRVTGVLGDERYTLTPARSDAHIMSPLPSNRVAENDDAWQVLAEPVYFSVFPPFGNWQKLTVDIVFSPGEQKVIELGLLGNLQFQSFDLAPVWNALIPTDWEVTPTEQGLLYTRPGVPTNLTSQSRDRLRVLRATADLPYDASAAQLLRTPSSLPYELAGAHEFFVALPASSEFTWRMTLRDVNGVRGSDEGVVKIIDPNGNLVTEHIWGDDGNVSDDRKMEEATRKIDVRARTGSAGAYRVVLVATSDMRFSAMTTNATGVVLNGRAHFVSCPATFITNAARITFEPRDVDAFGTPHVGRRAVKLERIGEKVSLALPEARSVIADCTGDMVVTAEGVIATSSMSFFPATILPLTQSTNIDNVDAILVKPLELTRDEEGRYHARVIFDLAGKPLERGAYRLMLSVPGVAPENDVHVERIDVDFSRDRQSLLDVARTLKQYLYGLLP